MKSPSSLAVRVWIASFCCLVGRIDAADKLWAFMMLEFNGRALQALRRQSKSAVSLNSLEPRPEVVRL